MDFPHEGKFRSWHVRARLGDEAHYTSVFVHPRHKQYQETLGDISKGISPKTFNQGET